MKTKLNKTILVADDDVDYLEQIKLQVKEFGFDVITAGSQKEAEKLMCEQRPDLALFDLMMENQDSGFILTYKFKKLYPEVPVIIATAVTAETGLVFNIENSDDKNWIRADKYLEKGLRPDQLHREINKLLKI